MGRPKKRPSRAVDPDRSKKPRVERGPPAHRSPRSLDPVQHLESLRPLWRTGAIDLDGRWGWRVVEAEVILQDVVTRLHDYETMPWTQFRGKLNHDVELPSLCANARRRLREIGKDDLDSLFSIRIDGKRRVWAVRSANILHLLWWDPEHEVCPSHQRHT